MAEGPYRGMKCGNCNRVYEIPKPRKPPHLCPVCEFTLQLTLDKPTVDNYMPLVVDAAAERLRVQGFRFGDQQDADDEAWAIWQANGLDAHWNALLLWEDTRNAKLAKLEEALNATEAS